MKCFFYPLSLMAALILNVSVIGVSKIITAGKATPKFNHAATGVIIHKNFYTPKDIIYFLDSDMSRLPKTESDRYLIQLITLQKNYQKYYEKQLFSHKLNSRINQYEFQDLIALRNIREDDIKKLMQNIFADGFKLSTSEGMVYMEIDYPRLQRELGWYVSREIDEYLKIMSQETARHFSEDAGLMISPDMLGCRITEIEAFCKKYPRFSRLDDIRQLYKMYLKAYLIGMNNTPAFSYETNRLDERFLESYSNSVKVYKGTEFANLIHDYLKILKQNNYKKTRAVLDFVTKDNTVETINSRFSIIHGRKYKQVILSVLDT